MIKPNFQQQFRAARRVSTPLVAVGTADPASALQQIKESLNSKLDITPLLTWDILRGLRGENNVGKSLLVTMLNFDITAFRDRDGRIDVTKCDQALKAKSAEKTANPVLLLNLLAEKPAKDAIFVAFNFHLYWKEAAPIKQGIWNLRDPFKNGAAGNMLVMTTTLGATVPPELAQDVLVIDEPLPTPAELEAVVKDVAEADGVKLEAEQIGKAVDAVAGLAKFPAESAVAMSISKKDGLDLESLWERKRQEVEHTSGLSIYRGATPEPVGLDAVREHIKLLLNGERKYRCVLFCDEIEKQLAGSGTDLSGVTTKQTGSFLTWTQEKQVDGVLFIGVAGGGKSMLAKWAASVAGIPCIIWDIAGTQSSLIGSTEERQRAVFAIVDAISQGDVLMIATCNSIGQMTPEMLRRFQSGVWFFDLMSEAEREACWQAYGKKYGVDVDSKAIPNDEGWTGAEIETCVKKARQLRLTPKQAAQYIVPVSRSSSETIRKLRESATGRYLSASQGGTYRWEDEVQAAAPKTTGGRKFRDEDGPAVVEKKGGRA